MNKEQQRIKIAEACGWETNKRKWLAKPPNDSWQYLDTMPDYLNDLNAMHEAEKNLKPKQQVNYWNWVNKLAGNDPTNSIYLVWGDAIFATAAQRAEAFLRTLNLWED